MKEHSETLDLVLCYKWYDMIESGEKKEEYREIDKWKKRLSKYSYRFVRFRRGYTSRSITFELERIKIGRGKHRLGAPFHPVYILKLGKMVGCS